MKFCRSCQARKPLDGFALGKRHCDQCVQRSAEQRRQYLAAWRKAKGAQAQREWRKRHPDYDKEYYRRKKERQVCN